MALIPTNLAFNIKSSDYDALADGGSITAILDGFGGSYTPRAGTAEATLKKNIFNGKSGIVTVGTSNYVGTLTSVAVTSSYTCQWAGTINTAFKEVTFGQIMFDKTNGRMLFQPLTATGDVGYYDGALKNTTAAVTDDSIHVWSLVLDGIAGTGTVYQDGILVGTGTYTAVAGNIGGTIGVFAAEDSFTAPCYGILGEWGIYNAALSSADRQANEAYLRAAYVVYLIAAPSVVQPDTNLNVNLLGTAATGGVGAVTYQYFRSTTAGSKGTAITGATTLSYVDTTISTAGKYFYTLEATDSVGNVTDSPQVSINVVTKTAVFTDAFTGSSGSPVSTHWVPASVNGIFPLSPAPVWEVNGSGGAFLASGQTQALLLNDQTTDTAHQNAFEVRVNVKSLDGNGVPLFAWQAAVDSSETWYTGYIPSHNIWDTQLYNAPNGQTVQSERYWPTAINVVDGGTHTLVIQVDGPKITFIVDGIIVFIQLSADLMGASPQGQRRVGFGAVGDGDGVSTGLIFSNFELLTFPPSNLPYKLLTVNGNSRDLGYQGTPDTYSWSAQAILNAAGGNYANATLALGGQPMDYDDGNGATERDMVNTQQLAYLNRILNAYPWQTTVLVIDEVINQLFQAGSTAARTYAIFASYILARKADGWKHIFISACTPFQADNPTSAYYTTTTADTARLAVNADLQANAVSLGYTFYDPTAISIGGVTPFASLATSQTDTGGTGDPYTSGPGNHNGTYWYIDRVHYVANGYNTVGALIAQTIIEYFLSALVSAVVSKSQGFGFNDNININFGQGFGI